MKAQLYLQIVQLIKQLTKGQKVGLLDWLKGEVKEEELVSKSSIQERINRLKNSFGTIHSSVEIPADALKREFLYREDRK